MIVPSFFVLRQIPMLTVTSWELAKGAAHFIK
jgi:hypothetical protein